MTQEARELVERLRKRLGGIDLPQAGTDNLAIVLATYFDDGGEERNKHPAWSDAAIGGAESSLDAIHAHYATTITTLLDKLEAAERNFWIELREPGRTPERKGPFPHHMTAMYLREFMRARPSAFITVVSIGSDGPMFQDGPECLQMLDGRSMETGRKHIASSNAAHRSTLADKGVARNG